MGDSQEKMHLMISSKGLENKAVTVYDSTVQKYNFGMIKTMNEAMRNESPCLVTMKGDLVKKGGDPGLVDKVLQLMIAKTARSFNLTRNIEPAQIEVLVEDLQSEYYYLKLSEVFFVLKQARLGRNGKTYERLDQPTIMSWFDEYAEKRLTAAEEESLQKHEQSTHSEKDRQYDGYISKLHADQKNDEDKRIMNIAYGMAKKMQVNEVLRSQNFQIPEQTQPQQQPEQNSSGSEEVK